jgi:3-dehydroquinate synthase
MAPTIIPVPLPQNAYNVILSAGGLAELGPFLSDRTLVSPPLGQKALIVSNPQIWKHYGETVTQSLKQANFTVKHCILPAGERYKTLRSIEKIYNSALNYPLERGSFLVALGGGVIGDMTGFAAATWLRGISVVQIPTTLLGMVDAAIGGKTGVNHPQGKNLIGAFHQPRLVLIDPETLNTLPEREFRAGMAEVVKYGVIWDAELFQNLATYPTLKHRRFLSPEMLLDILRRSCQTKVDVVAQDEKESGLRAILNYGHTIGHAIESLTHYRVFKHGEGVGLGMLAIGQIAVELNLWSKDCAAQQYNLIQKIGLPTQLPSDFPVDAVVGLLLTDKKVQSGKVRFIVPRGIGQVEITDQIPSESILRALKLMQPDS